MRDGFYWIVIDKDEMPMSIHHFDTGAWGRASEMSKLSKEALTTLGFKAKKVWIGNEPPVATAKKGTKKGTKKL